MSVFVLSVAAVKAAYDTYVTAKTATAAAQAAITGAGAAPTPPNYVVADADWNNYVTSLDSWTSTNAGLINTLTTAKATQRTAELAVIAAMGYNTGNESQSICLDQWVKVVGAGAGPLTYTKYIGASAGSLYLTELSDPPTQHYPKY